MNNVIKNFNSISHDFSKLIRNEYDLNGTIFDLKTYSNISGVEKIKSNKGKEYSFDGKNSYGFSGKAITKNKVEVNKCPSEKWAFQGGCWPFKKDGKCKHMEK